MKPTMKDVAREAGVSVMTVSLALRHHSRIPESTAARIREVAATMGYAPNPLISALISQIRANRPLKAPPVIGFVSSFPQRRRWWVTKVNREYYEGAQARAKELGFGFELFELATVEMNGQRLSQVMLYRNVCGLLLGPVPKPGMDLGLAWDRFPSVAFGYSMPEPPIHRATLNHYHAMQTALNRLSELGYRRIAVVTSNYANQRTGDMFLAAADVASRRLPPSRRVPPLFITQAGIDEEKFNTWIKRHRPDAIVDAVFNEFHRFLVRKKIKLPKGTGLATMSRQENLPELAGIEQNSSHTGAVAVDLLIQQIYSNQRGIPPHQVFSFVNGYWVDGASAPPVPPKRQDRGTSRKK